MASQTEASQTVENQSVAELPEPDRRAIAAAWLSRASAELTTATVTASVARALIELDAVTDVVVLAARAVSDEVRHSQLCHALAEAYLGQKLAPPRARLLEDASFGDAPPKLNRLLLVVYHSCLNEGIATTVLQENLRLARAPAVRRVLHELLQDDVEHARIGWAHLASSAVGAEARHHVGRALPALLRAVRNAWLDPRDSPDVDHPEHGCLPHASLAPIVEAAIESLILPGFAHVGVAVPGLGR